jgi:hypothetical protein
MVVVAAKACALNNTNASNTATRPARRGLNVFFKESEAVKTEASNVRAQLFKSAMAG